MERSEQKGAQAPDSHVLVPREPTEAMLDAGLDSMGTPISSESMKHFYQAMVAAAAPASPPCDHVLVPREATPEMREAGWIDKEDVEPHEIWRAMVAAAPASHPSDDAVERVARAIRPFLPTSPSLWYNAPAIARAAISAMPAAEKLREALRSIADNTCCDGCQEAARVARKALGEKP